MCLYGSLSSAPSLLLYTPSSLVHASGVDLSHDMLQAVHILEDVGDTELPSLAGGDVLRTVKIISKEVRLSSKVAKAGMERLCAALTSVSTACL